MADVALAIHAVVLQEDSKLSGVVTIDRGGRTRFGIAERFHPWIADIGFYTDMIRDQALGAALAVYAREYSLPLWIAKIPDQVLATKLLSLAVNDGITYPVKWLQEAVGAVPDGAMGPATIAAINRTGYQKALDALKEQAVTYYEKVVLAHPEEAGNLNGWINRANA